MHEWKPIETAPKDEPVLVLDAPVWPNRPFTAKQIYTTAGYKWHDLSANRWSEPTHWMPLPAPPVDEKAQQG